MTETENPGDDRGSLKETEMDVWTVHPPGIGGKSSLLCPYLRLVPDPLTIEERLNRFTPEQRQALGEMLADELGRQRQGVLS